MDEFGVLVESIGFKSQRNSAPLSHLKSNTKTSFNFPQEREISSKNPSRSHLYGDPFVDNGNLKKSQNYFDDKDDVFGVFFENSKQKEAKEGSFDLDSVFDFNKNSSFRPSSNLYDDFLTNGVRKDDAVDDLLANFEMKKDGNGSQFDDLIPGFRGSNSSSKGSRNHGLEPEIKLSQTSMADDPLLVFESPAEDTSSWPFSDSLEQNAKKASFESSIDELEEFARGKVPDNASDKPFGETLGNIRISLEKKNVKASSGKDMQAEIVHGKQKEKYKERAHKVTKGKKEAVPNEGNLDNIFGVDPHPSNVNRPSSQTEDPVLETLFNEKRGPEVTMPPSRPPYNKEKPPPAAIFFDDFFQFGEATPSTGEFQEKQGENEERRRARLNHHMRTQARMAKALAEKNQRDIHTQYEQEERRRLADSLDYNIKRWSAGKEDNLRALLSSLQDVLWPECGWQPVSLTDLITSTSVKKVYYKATLCVHPDKVQQKGSNLQQKYIAEKVFDLLKEAWNKFSAAELR